MKLNKLTPEEEKVIIRKETELPFSGEYDNFFEEGIYLCRRCGAALYESKNKFASGCGWPSFDEEIPGKVKHIPDPDGKRIEIICGSCGAHLGHVFHGEGLTPKNTRHCVNSLSLRFLPRKRAKKIETAVFGGGCFWCTEAVFSRLKGVMKVTPGYAGGRTANPIYEDVSGGKTGHAEAVKIDYDPDVIGYDDLLKIFFATHDPTTVNRQGHDIGTQYRSIILYANEHQRKASERIIKKLTNEQVFSRPIVTEIKPLEEFYEAERYHRHYYDKNAFQPYCEMVIAPKLSKIRKEFSRFLKK